MKRSLGQNFLKEPLTQKRLLEHLLLGPKDFRECVLEIGPGEGALTQHLAGHIQELWLVEKDDVLAAAWKERIAEFEAQGTKLIVIHGDALEADLPWERFKSIVGNLPFNVATAIYTRILTHSPNGTNLYLMFQKEVGQRLLALTGKEYGSLSIFAQAHGPMKRLYEVPPSSFFPRPRVASWFLYQRVQRPATWTSSEIRLLEELLHVSFAHRRKALLKRLLPVWPDASENWNQRGWLASRRAEEINLHQWMGLVDTLTSQSHSF